MYYHPYHYSYPYYGYVPMYDYRRQGDPFLSEMHTNRLDPMILNDSDRNIMLKDYGPNPYVVNIDEAVEQNNTFRTALWTGNHLQVTLMSLGMGEEIGLEMHPDVDQFLRVEQGQGVVQMGKHKERLDFNSPVREDFAILIPAGTWHNLMNTGNIPLKLYSIYAPPNHPFGTVHATKTEAEAAEEHSH